MNKQVPTIVRRLTMAGLLWLIFVAVPSIPGVRNFLAAPLVLSQANPQGDLCYVMADGIATRERLAAAADLYHLNRVAGILLTENTMTGPYNFKAKASWTATQWELEYLAWLGVPADRVALLQPNDGFLGTLKEARNVARQLPPGARSIVIVSSAPHMRRCMLAFGRSLPADVKIIPYAATSFAESAEMPLPIWIEYLKLLVYFVVA